MSVFLLLSQLIFIECFIGGRRTPDDKSGIILTIVHSENKYQRDLFMIQWLIYTLPLDNIKLTDDQIDAYSVHTTVSCKNLAQSTSQTLLN